MSKNESRFFKEKHNAYCAFCKSPRRIYRKKNINLVNVLASMLASIALMFLFWQAPDPRVMIVFVFCLALSEVFVKIRWRLSVLCNQCGFDPILYVKDSDAAAEKVKARLQQRREDPAYLLAKPLNLPTISADKAKALQHKDKKGQLVSREI